MLTSHAAFGDIHYPAYTQTLIISENLHAARFLTQTAQCVLTALCERFPSKSMKKRYSQLRSSIGRLSIFVIFRLL